MAELQEGAAPEARARKQEIDKTKATIARLEFDVASGGTVLTKRIMGNELARQRKQLEARTQVVKGLNDF